MEIKLIGVGGIGTALAPFLARYFQHNRSLKARITLVDGDAFEPENRARQEFARLGNKAVVKAEELARAFPSVPVRALAQFVAPDNIAAVVRAGDTVLLAVDNYATRRLVSKHCEGLDAVTLISGGNELTDGNVQVYLRRNGADASRPLTYLHPEIENPADLLPTDAGCERLIATAAPQLLFTNLAVASAMLGALYAIIEQGQAPYDELYLDLPSGRQLPVRR